MKIKVKGNDEMAGIAIQFLKSLYDGDIEIEDDAVNEFLENTSNLKTTLSKFKLSTSPSMRQLYKHIEPAFKSSYESIVIMQVTVGNFKKESIETKAEKYML